MKTTLDYVIGNTAVQIVQTRGRIKVIDVEKEKIRKKFLSRLILVTVVTAICMICCFTVVQMENQKVLLDNSVYSLRSQVEDLEKENLALQKQSEETAIDYDSIYKRALALGMKFPKQSQVKSYSVEKSTAVRINTPQKQK
jgi:cell division protein FtsL